jgi:hypothetical protein
MVYPKGIRVKVVDGPLKGRTGICLSEEERQVGNADGAITFAFPLLMDGVPAGLQNWAIVDALFIEFPPYPPFTNEP